MKNFSRTFIYLFFSICSVAAFVVIIVMCVLKKCDENYICCLGILFLFFFVSMCILLSIEISKDESQEKIRNTKLQHLSDVFCEMQGIEKVTDENKNNNECPTGVLCDGSCCFCKIIKVMNKVQRDLENLKEKDNDTVDLDTAISKVKSCLENLENNTYKQNDFEELIKDLEACAEKTTGDAKTEIGNSISEIKRVICSFNKCCCCDYEEKTETKDGEKTTTTTSSCKSTNSIRADMFKAYANAIAEI